MKKNNHEKVMEGAFGSVNEFADSLRNLNGRLRSLSPYEIKLALERVRKCLRGNDTDKAQQLRRFVWSLSFHRLPDCCDRQESS